jgi:hypothetical protein
LVEAEVQPITPDVQQLTPEVSLDRNPALEPEPALEPPTLDIAVATAAPLATTDPAPSDPAPSDPAPSESGASQVLGLPLQFLNQLLQKLGATPLASLADLVPALQILGLAVLAGIALKLTGATLDAINEIPLVGGLLELVGLVALLNSLARNAFKQQRRAELLDRIRKLRKDLLG